MGPARTHHPAYLRHRHQPVRAIKVLVVRFSSIGDIVLTTPVIRGLREQSGAEVHFLTKRSFASTLAENPYLERVWTIEKHLSEVAADLKKERFDHLVDLHGNLRTLELKARLFPGPRVRTFNKLNFKKLLLTKFRIDRMPDVHIVDRYLATVRRLGVTNDGRGLDFFVSETDRVDLERAGIPQKFVAFVIGAAHATKRLTGEQILEFCRSTALPVVLLGGPAEAEQGAEIARRSEQTINACGRFSLAGSADLVRQASVVVTHDTGLMHVAAAFGKPILSVWGNTVPALGMYPYLPGRESTERTRRSEVPGLECRPCSKIGHAACPRGHFRCIREQDASLMADRAGRIAAAD